ncbi:MAG: proline--tRNA ligase [Bacteroidota bacterium]
MSNKKISSREEDYSQWYNDLVIRGNLADYSSVRGCMVIKPHGYAIWENMKDALDKMFKDTGHVNAYFPLFVPKHLFEAEEKNAEGFAKECAVVTHYRLKNDPDNPGKLIVDPEAKLEEELIVRPTSEAIIWSTYKNWIQSYRDLPLLINQWANVVRWEMRTRLFLRTAEFLWQEGHTAHASAEEAIEETERMLEVYETFAREFMALPVYKGVKPEHEKFAGAEKTYTIEAMTQDKQAIQAGTSHYLGQNFAKAFDVKFQNKEGGEEYVYATSWGVSTRLIGTLIMAHSDDDGLILPPKLAPIQVVIIPLFVKDAAVNAMLIEKAQELKNQLLSHNIKVKIDLDESKRPGFKFAEYELLGMPVRVVIGPRDLEQGKLEICRRDTKEKYLCDLTNVDLHIKELLVDIQQSIYDKALKFRTDNTFEVTDYEGFKEVIQHKGGFVITYWDGLEETANKIKTETKATIRCILENNEDSSKICVYSKNIAKHKVIFAENY